MNKTIKILVGFFVTGIILVGGFFAFNSYIYNQKQADTNGDENVGSQTSGYKNTTYTIDGSQVTLVNGSSVTPIENSSASVVTTYFGNELFKDLNDDGRDDVVFLLTQQTGGSGTFYYVVASLNTDNGYVGSQALLLGDRIAPQNINISENPKHKNVIVVNFVDRGVGEPMTSEQSIGKSVYLKLDVENMQWGIVANDFEGESR